MDGRRIVEEGYDQIADQYLVTKNATDPIILAMLADMARELPRDGSALDLGCGAGVPVTRWLSEHFQDVTGVDISRRQLDLARRHVPAARFIQSDMLSLTFPAATFDAIVAFYSIIHVPREQQATLVQNVYQWLKPGGAFLANWALRASEGAEENWQNWGAPMWWSHHDAETSIQMLHTAGFQIESSERRTIDEETWLWVLARC